MKKYLKAFLLTLVVVAGTAGILAFLKEYAKSSIRNAVRDDALAKIDSGEDSCEVPSGSYLSVPGDDDFTGPDYISGWVSLVTYEPDNTVEVESLHSAGVIEIPSLNIREAIWKENTPVAMRYGVIVMKEFAGVNEAGNCVIVGHRNTITHTVFDKLTKIRMNDAALITTPDGIKHKYRVNGTYYCSPYDLENYVGTSPDHPVMITLITCAREKGNDWRFIVTLVPC